MPVPYRKVVIITHVDITNDPANPSHRRHDSLHRNSLSQTPKNVNNSTAFPTLFNPHFPTPPRVILNDLW